MPVNVPAESALPAGPASLPAGSWGWRWHRHSVSVLPNTTANGNWACCSCSLAVPHLPCPGPMPPPSSCGISAGRRRRSGLLPVMWRACPWWLNDLRGGRSSRRGRWRGLRWRWRPGWPGRGRRPGDGEAGPVPGPARGASGGPCAAPRISGRQGRINWRSIPRRNSKLTRTS